MTKQHREMPVVANNLPPLCEHEFVPSEVFGVIWVECRRCGEPLGACLPKPSVRTDRP